MASKRGAQKEFKTLIFSNANLTQSACAPIFKDLERNPDQVSRVLSDRAVLVALLSNFDGYAERITQFFKQADRAVDSTQEARISYAGSGLPDALIRDFLPRLLGDEFRQFQMNPAFHNLFSSVVSVCLALRSAQLGALAKALGEKEELLELLISGENSGQVMRKWIHTFDAGNTLFKSNVFAAWTKRLIALCHRCGDNHLTSRQSHIWRDLQDLISRLTEALDIFTSMPKKAPKLAPLADLRKSAGRDERPGSSRTRLPQNISENPIAITTKDSSLLGNFGIEPPESERALRDAIKKLQGDETIKILKALADSFPCGPCYQASIGSSQGGMITEEELPVEREKHIRSRVLFAETFGASLGIWRICFSAQALRDLEQSQSEGKS